MVLRWLQGRVLSCVVAASLALVAVRAYWRSAMISNSRGKDEEEEEVAPPPAVRQRTEAVEAVEQRPVFPLADLPRDALVAALELLSAVDLSKAAGASRLLFLIVGEVQRRPSLVAEAGPPQSVLAALGRRLQATPTLGFLFSTGDLADNAIAEILRRRLPPSCDVIGARTEELQALVPEGEARGATMLGVVRERGQIAMQLGSFPDAEARSFHIPKRLCGQIARAQNDAAAQALLREHNYPLGSEWKTIVLVSAGVDPEPVVRGFQRGHPGTAIIGGIAESQLLVHSRGRTRVEKEGVAGLALRGDVPLTALVSRGCSALSAAFKARGARVVTSESEDDAEAEQALLIPEFVGEDGASVLPIHVAIEAQRRMRGVRMMFSGVRFGDEGGFLLEQLSNDCFQQGGALLLPLQEAPAEAEVQGCEVRFYGLDADECRNDLRRLLGHIKTQCEQREERALGAVMFTCGGRGARFFGEDHADAKEFQAAFPSLPLAGFWAGGEIGPQALVEAALEQATRTGRATLQGFTAVFGIFRAPLPAARSWLAALGDEGVPAAVGEVLARLATEAQARADAARAAGEPAEAHAARARALAEVPSAAAALSEEARAAIVAIAA